MNEQDWMALGVTFFVLTVIGAILYLGISGAFTQW
jgi:hypothetical protein